MKNNIVFLIQCPDLKGLLSKITSYFYDCGFNILDCQQHTDTNRNQYYMRIKLDLNDLKSSRKTLYDKFSAFAEPLALKWSVNYSDSIPKVAILVSKTSHCLYDILLKNREGDLKCEIPIIISNHPNLEFVADQFKIPFYSIPVTKENKQTQEKKVISLLNKHHIDLVVMARYMQILSSDIINKYPSKIINIHHAFLPAFQGARPYLRAFERGVKMIGATAHYATENLDQGPIIDQGIERVNHEDLPEDLERIGKGIESAVLSRAVKAHLESRIIVSDNRTVVFSSGA